MPLSFGMPLISGIIGAAAHVVDSIASPPSGCMGLFLRFLRAPPTPGVAPLWTRDSGVLLRVQPTRLALALLIVTRPRDGVFCRA